MVPKALLYLLFLHIIPQPPLFLLNQAQIGAWRGEEDEHEYILGLSLADVLLCFKNGRCVYLLLRGQPGFQEKKKKGLLLSSFSPYWGWEEESDGPVKMKALLLAVGISYCKTWNFCLFV